MPTTYTNPGAIANVVTLSGRIESTWGNAVRDRLVNNFASAAARNAAIPSPVVGQTCVTVISGIPTFQVYASVTSGWCPPWNMPWGQVAYVSVTSTQSGITTLADVTSATVTFTAVANRNYKATIVCRPSNSTIDVDNVITLTDSSNTVLISGATINAATSAGYTFMESDVFQFSAGSKTLKMRASCPSGSLTIGGATRATVILVEDTGPNGTP